MAAAAEVTVATSTDALEEVAGASGRSEGGASAGADQDEAAATEFAAAAAAETGSGDGGVEATMSVQMPGDGTVVEETTALPFEEAEAQAEGATGVWPDTARKDRSPVKQKAADSLADSLPLRSTLAQAASEPVGVLGMIVGVAMPLSHPPEVLSRSVKLSRSGKILSLAQAVDERDKGMVVGGTAGRPVPIKLKSQSSFSSFPLHVPIRPEGSGSNYPGIGIGGLGAAAGTGTDIDDADSSMHGSKSSSYVNMTTGDYSGMAGLPLFGYDAHVDYASARISLVSGSGNGNGKGTGKGAGKGGKRKTKTLAADVTGTDDDDDDAANMDGGSDGPRSPQRHHDEASYQQGDDAYGSALSTDEESRSGSASEWERGERTGGASGKENRRNRERSKGGQKAARQQDGVAPWVKGGSTAGTWAAKGSTRVSGPSGTNSRSNKSDVQPEKVWRTNNPYRPTQSKQLGSGVVLGNSPGNSIPHRKTPFMLQFSIEQVQNISCRLKINMRICETRDIFIPLCIFTFYRSRALGRGAKTVCSGVMHLWLPSIHLVASSRCTAGAWDGAAAVLSSRISESI